MLITAHKEKRASPVARKERSAGVLLLCRCSGRSTVKWVISFAPTGAQAKLTIGEPNDKYEQEADTVADKVMRMPDADVAQRVETETVQPMHIQRYYLPELGSNDSFLLAAVECFSAAGGVYSSLCR